MFAVIINSITSTSAVTVSKMWFVWHNPNGNLIIVSKKVLIDLFPISSLSRKKADFFFVWTHKAVVDDESTVIFNKQLELNGFYTVFSLHSAHGLVYVAFNKNAALQIDTKIPRFLKSLTAWKTKSISLFSIDIEWLASGKWRKWTESEYNVFNTIEIFLGKMYKVKCFSFSFERRVLSFFVCGRLFCV